ncbi:hypothetical protein ACTFIV_003178 [Dictyostelium citrinum]
MHAAIYGEAKAIPPTTVSVDDVSMDPLSDEDVLYVKAGDKHQFITHQHKDAKSDLDKPKYEPSYQLAFFDKLAADWQSVNGTANLEDVEVKITIVGKSDYLLRGAAATPDEVLDKDVLLKKEGAMPFVRFKVKEAKLTSDSVTSLKRFFGLIDMNIKAVKIVQAFQAVDTNNECLLENSLVIITRLPDGSKRDTHIWNFEVQRRTCSFKPELLKGYQVYTPDAPENATKPKRSALPTVFLTESVFKACALHRLGLNALSVLGSTLCNPLYHQLPLLLVDLVCCGDDDKAGLECSQTFGRGFVSHDLYELSPAELLHLTRPFTKIMPPSRRGAGMVSSSIEISTWKDINKFSASEAAVERSLGSIPAWQKVSTTAFSSLMSTFKKSGGSNTNGNNSSNSKPSSESSGRSNNFTGSAGSVTSSSNTSNNRFQENKK